MSKTLFSKCARCFAIAGLGLIFWYVFFVRWPGVSIDDVPCYSPNHEFYIKRFRSWLAFVLPKDSSMSGVVRVYGKSGKLIVSFHQKHFDYETGRPLWFGQTISYVGDDEKVIHLPAQVGETKEMKQCF